MRQKCVSASDAFLPISLPTQSTFAAHPSERGHDGGDAARIGGAEPVDRSAACGLSPTGDEILIRLLLLEAERTDGDLKDGRPLLDLKEPADRLFPRVAFVARRLLGLDVLLLEFATRPPGLALTVERDGFGK